MTLPQLTVLHLINAPAPVTLTELAQALGTKPPATSAMVDRLTHAGLVHPLSVLPLALGAMEVGAAASGGGKTAAELEVTQVVYEARAASAVVLTYDPDRCTGHRINVVDLRP
jgi:DNA-binding IclR family transcriptional regulator